MSKRRRSDGFTEPQRQWILARDSVDGKRTCQLCGDDAAYQYEVHHIIPWRWASTVLNWTLERVNNPTNGITLCKECHVGDPNNSVHPDWARGMSKYGEVKNQNPGEEKKVVNSIFAFRDDLCRKQLPYWNTAHDNTMVMIAIVNTMEYIAEGNEIYPITKPREGGIRKKIVKEHKETVVEKVILKEKGNVDIVTPNFQGSMLSYLAINK